MKKEWEEEMKNIKQVDKVAGDTGDMVDKATKSKKRELDKSPDIVTYLKGQRDKMFMNTNKTIQDTNIVKSLVSKFEQGDAKNFQRYQAPV